jgi:hypothetical protein
MTLQKKERKDLVHGRMLERSCTISDAMEYYMLTTSRPPFFRYPPCLLLPK